jgi:hypothetical protein
MNATGIMLPSHYGYGEHLASMHICSTCFHLYDIEHPDEENQRCQCQPVDEIKWPVGDFNEHAILCRCCGLNVLPSGSRWHMYFCRECQLLAMGVSVWDRRLVFPIGPHSLMHTWVPKTPSASLRDHRDHPEKLAEGVYRALQGVVRGSEGLWQWYKTVMPRNLEHFGLAGEVSLRVYMEAVAAEAPALSSRLKAFDGLCQFFQLDPADPFGGTNQGQEEVPSAALTA